MSKRIRAKYKINRRYGVDLWGRAKSPVHRRNYRPGQHGQSRHKRTDYGNQLAAKQKLKGYYGNIGERQFRNIYSKATAQKGDASENLITLLERRLDAVVMRMKFAPTVFSARQLVNHGHIRVNGKRLNIPSYRVKDGDIIDVRPLSREIPLVVQSLNASEREIPDYLFMDSTQMSGTYVRGPGLADVPYPVNMEPNLVVEFYSR